MNLFENRTFFNYIPKMAILDLSVRENGFFGPLIIYKKRFSNKDLLGHHADPNST